MTSLNHGPNTNSLSNNGLKDALLSTTEKISERAESVYGQAKASAATVESFVKRNPMTMVFAAAGLGWVAGRFLGKSRMSKSSI